MNFFRSRKEHLVKHTKNCSQCGTKVEWEDHSGQEPESIVCIKCFTKSEPTEEWTIKDYEQWGERNASKPTLPNDFVSNSQNIIDYKEWYEKNKITANSKRQMKPFEPFTYKREDKNIHTSDGVRFCATCGQKFSNHEEYLKHNFQSHGCSDL